MGSKRVIILEQDSEADTCRKEVTPKLYASEWKDDQILEQRVFTDGKIVILGKVAKRQTPKKADYVLRIGQNFPIAVLAGIYCQPYFECRLRTHQPAFHKF